ncbi:MAG: 16S rRNA (guanine(527)-N(7))-methyltransferase RsmG [Alphaproteobacteria bacterium]|nr:16S rRNA (guanine(527)-N(7))-methyltransferase RsmG [Alphaproteobacteria bacterium]
MDSQEKFEKYETLLRDWNARINLVGPSTLDDARIRHINDSKQLAKYLEPGTSVIDLGAGAGFPGVVLAIMGFDVICVESIAKKCAFLDELKKELDLPNLTVINDRVENFVPKLKPNATQNTVFTARAFAPLVKIFDMTFSARLPYILLKGEAIMPEIMIARKKYEFDAKLIPSETGPGFIAKIDNLRPLKNRPF